MCFEIGDTKEKSSDVNNTISIVLPVYNAEKYLQEAVLSILYQTYPNIELIIIDDGSQDSSAEFCDALSSDNRVIVVHKPFGIVQAARTAGIIISTGRYITFVDADDALELNAYDAVIRAFREYDADLVAYEYKRDNEIIEISDEIICCPGDYSVIKKPEIYNNFMSGDYYGGILWNKAWRKETIKNIMFRTDIQITEDAVFVWDSLKNVNTAVMIKKPLYHYRILLGSLSNNTSLERFMSSLLAWEYLKQQAEEKATTSIRGIRRNRLIWTLKTLKAMAYVGREKYDSVILIDRIRQEQELICTIPRADMIGCHIIFISWRMWVLWVRLDDCRKAIMWKRRLQKKIMVRKIPIPIGSLR